MNDEIRKKLDEPFASALVKKRKGPKGKWLSYVPVTEYVRRLNEIFAGDWSFEITHREQHEDHVLVQGRLIVAGVTKCDIGGATLRRGDDGTLQSLSDDFKAAASDCLKRCCRLLGMGAELYSDDPVDAPVPGATAQENGERPAHAENGRGGRITVGQMRQLKELVAELGSDWHSFRRWVQNERGVTVEYASRGAASELIQDLIGRARRQRANGHGHRQMNGRAS